MDEAEQEWKRKECFGTNKTRKESSRFLLELKHRKLPVTASTKVRTPLGGVDQAIAWGGHDARISPVCCTFFSFDTYA
eukprot:scaffold67788_cov48-Attheya_sp.AAC.2